MCPNISTTFLWLEQLNIHDLYGEQRKCVTVTALRVLLKACKITKIYRFYASIQFEYYSSSEIQIHVFTFRKYSKITHIHLLHITEMENRSLQNST